MPFEIETKADCFLLPGDGAAAEREILKHLADPSELYIVAFGFTLPQIIDQLLANYQAGDPVHVYLDHSQAGGQAERPEVQRLVDAGVEVTIGTSPVGSRYICHSKAIVCLDDPAPWCWEGSVNFSRSGFEQVNTALQFNSSEWAAAFVNQFKGLRQFAWTHEANYQLMANPPPDVSV